MAESITTYPQFGQDVVALIPLMKAQSNYVASMTSSTSGNSVSTPHSESATIWVIQCIVAHALYSNANATESSFTCIIPIDAEIYLGQGGGNAYSFYVKITSSEITLRSTHRSYANGTIIATPIY